MERARDAAESIKRKDGNYHVPAGMTGWFRGQPFPKSGSGVGMSGRV